MNSKYHLSPDEVRNIIYNHLTEKGFTDIKDIGIYVEKYQNEGGDVTWEGMTFKAEFNKPLNKH